MKKKLLSLALALVMCLGLTVPAFAAEYTEVIPCKYARVGDFSDGLAAVAIQVGTDKNGNGIFRWGFIDKAGKEVIPCQYVYPGGYYPEQNPHFSEDMAAVVIDDGITEHKIRNYCGKYCFIDKTGKEIIPGKYDTASDFSEGLAMVGVWDGTTQYIPGANAYIYNFDCGFIDKTGKEVVPLKYDAARDFSEGLAAVRVGNDSTTWEWGFIDQTGKEVISPRCYRLVKDFSEGLVAVRDQNGKWGFIDKSGKEVIPCQYTSVGDFSEGLAAVHMDDGYGFIDKTGNVVIHCPYVVSNVDGTYPGGFSEGLAAVADAGGRRYYYIDKTGKEIFTVHCNFIKNFSEGLAVKCYVGKYGYIDKTGNEVVPCQYAWACPVSEGMAAVAIKGETSGAKNFKWGFICLGDVPVAEQEQPTEPEKPTVAADSDLVIVDGVLTKYVGPGGNVVLPSSVTSIGSGAFKLCWKLTSVTIPDSVTSIGYQAFAECGNLTSVTIGNGVTSIGDYAFNKCESLTSVTLPNGMASTGEWTFAYCKSLTNVTIPNSVTSIGEGTFHQCSSLTSVTIPNSVTNISDAAFNWCQGLTSVTIPSNVTSIGKLAFNSCDRLKDVYYGGTEAQWNTVQIEASNSSLTFATIHYNSAGPDQPTQPTVGGFSDVKASDYYAEPVAWAVEKGVTAGTSKTTFSPNATCTQGQILTFLWRAKGEPKPVGTVSGTQYYAAAAQWAKEQGLTDNFSAEADCTRAMVVTYLWKLAGSPKAGTSNFSDVPANADYAQAVAWAVEQGITSGVGNGQFAPNSTCTRGQIVAFLYRAFVG